MENKRKSCNRCIHAAMCRLFVTLLKGDFDKFFESQNVWEIANLCHYYKN